MSDDDELLNSSIGQGKILNFKKSLKSNKTSLNERILDGYIKHTSHILVPMYAFFSI